MFTRALRVAFIGNASPRRCGIATFTTDLEQAVADLRDVAETAIIAMRDPGGDYAWPPSVRLAINQEEAGDYRAAAEFLNTGGFDVVCLQHEFGIYGGEAGAYIFELIAALDVPLVTTLHTVLNQPSAAQCRAMDAILATSARVIVMARKGRAILIETYGADPARISVIPHGIPDAPLVSPEAAKARLGYSDRQVILTFGLISPNKGIEMMIEAMPAIIAAAPQAIYVVMGATHPHLLRDAGEAYRDGLLARVRKLGLENHVIFLNRFVDRPELLEHIAMCDVYVTPYLVAAQLTSGTLAFAHGMGRPVVSTPYWHAAELLADGSGVLVDFGDPLGLARAVSTLLGDAPARLAMGGKAYAASRSTIWANTARRYLACFRSVCRPPKLRPPGQPARTLALAPTRPQRPPPPLPATSNHHFLAMCDDTGILQHAIYTVPDRLHGYCVDDNARALLLCCMPHNGLNDATQAALTMRFASFVQHAWNPDNRRFRNFMSFARVWLEPAGSEDSHGRTLWALGVCAAQHDGSALSDWAARLFCAAMPTVHDFTSPRSWAFTLLGLDRYCRVRPEDDDAAVLRQTLAPRLLRRLAYARARAWVWFEDRLAYDNARLCEALIRSGLAMADATMVEAGLASLRWLATIQTAPAGHFRPVGSQGFLLARQAPAHFDQQPLEATATIAACAAAHIADSNGSWLAEAERAFAWFLGTNDLGLPLVDITAGVCGDGLHPTRANQNSGAESVLSWLMALADMRALAQPAASHTRPLLFSQAPLSLNPVETHALF